jgi:hypothetical protein
MGDAESPLEGFDLRNDTPIRLWVRRIRLARSGGVVRASLGLRSPGLASLRSKSKSRFARLGISLESRNHRLGFSSKFRRHCSSSPRSLRGGTRPPRRRRPRGPLRDDHHPCDGHRIVRPRRLESAIMRLAPSGAWTRPRASARFGGGYLLALMAGLIIVAIFPWISIGFL